MTSVEKMLFLNRISVGLSVAYVPEEQTVCFWFTV